MLGYVVLECLAVVQICGVLHVTGTYSVVPPYYAFLSFISNPLFYRRCQPLEQPGSSWKAERCQLLFSLWNISFPIIAFCKGLQWVVIIDNQGILWLGNREAWKKPIIESTEVLGWASALVPLKLARVKSRAHEASQAQTVAKQPRSPRPTVR